MGDRGSAVWGLLLAAAVAMFALFVLVLAGAGTVELTLYFAALVVLLALWLVFGVRKKPTDPQPPSRVDKP